LNRVKRDVVLPIDKEREEHDREEHGDDDDGFELEGNDKRVMEGLENALESLGAESGPREMDGEGKKREGELLDELAGRLEVLEKELIMSA
jgi:hypothetical protein